MEASIFGLSRLSPPPPPPKPLPARLEFEPDIGRIKQRLRKYGVYPTPKIIRNIRKKEIQKHNRRAKRKAESGVAVCSSNTPITKLRRQPLEDESRFQTLRREYKQFTGKIQGKGGGGGSSGLMVGKPWEGIERVKLKELSSGYRDEVGGGKLRREKLGELRELLEKDLGWVLEDDVHLEGFDWSVGESREFNAAKRWGGEGEAIRVLVDRLSRREITEKHWKFVRMMKQSGLQFTEDQLLKIVDKLGNKGCWKQALGVVHWVYADKQRKLLKSRFVYTKLLSVLGTARRPQEALRIFNVMLEDCQIYPDMAAYHSIAVTLARAGLLKELVKVIECMREKPTKRIKNLRQKNWNPVLEPDLVVYNAVLNACVPSHQWKGVSWVFDQLRKSGLRPNGATYGLAMEVMLESGKYELVHEFYGKMKRSGQAPKAITYKVLVRALWKEGKIDETVQVVRNMEQRGVIGTGSVYYELACCLCNNGRWQDSMLEVEKMKKLHRSKPLEVTFTGLITASMDGGHINDCIAIFHHMKDHCRPNIGTVNTMLKVYGRNDMFSNAKELFEEINSRKSGPYTSHDDHDVDDDDDGVPLVPDEYTYSAMLEGSARALQWEYFEHVYQEMTLSGFKLDLTKHSSLLLEASRAGKWNLLEHAFDSILEAGEIPPPTFFPEMLCHAIAQDRYERAVSLIETVAFARFQISKKQWTDVFQKNRDWINHEHLKNLLYAVQDCGFTSEPTVSNLSGSLISLCGISSSTHASAMDDNHGRFQGISSFSDDHHDENRQIPKLLSNVGLNAIDDDDYDDPSGEFANFLDNEFSRLGFEERQAPTDEEVDDESTESDLPSANEILEEWEERRRKDGLFGVFP